MKVYGEGEELLGGMHANGEVGEISRIHEGVRHGCVRHGCVISLWFFRVFMDEIVRYIKAGVGNVIMEMNIGDTELELHAVLCAGDARTGTQTMDLWTFNLTVQG